MNKNPINAQSSTYIHTQAHDLKTTFVKSILSLSGRKKQLEKTISTRQFDSSPTPIPSGFYGKYSIEQQLIHDRKLWKISPQAADSNRLVLYLHGGGYIANITSYDWAFIDKLITKSGCTFLVPDYPIAPEHHCMDAHRFLDTVYDHILQSYPNRPLTLIGNSCGGGLALSFVQRLINYNRPLPSMLILNSPWLDVELDNPDIAYYESKDKLLSVPALKSAGLLFAANLSTKDEKISPIHGRVDGLPETHVFIGSHDIFFPDVQRFILKA